jgi:environmental stress-induced protein Ves
MNWHRVALASIAPQPWRNGGGVTRELLAWPHAQDWRVRVSVAEISRAGPFSAYPGVARWFAVLAGEGVKLRVGGSDHLLRPQSPPLRFDGGAAVDCELQGGPTEDFNLMLRGRDGALERVNGRCERACRKGSLVGVYSHEHDVAFAAVEVRIVIPPRTLAWNIVPADERIDFMAAGALFFEVLP